MSIPSLLAEEARVDAIAVQAELDKAAEKQGQLKRRQLGIALGEARTLQRHAEKLVRELEEIAGTDRQYEGEGC